MNKKLKGALSGKVGMAVGIVGVGAIALAVGLHFGKAPATGGAAHGDAHAAAEHGKGHDSGHGAKHDEHGAAKHDDHGKAHDADKEDHADKVAQHGEHKSHDKSHAPSHGDHAAPVHAEAAPTLFDKVLGKYVHAWHSVQEKVDAVRNAELENERLRLENTHLRLSLEGLQFNCSAKSASTKTHEMEYKLDKETGSLVGRDLASIAYRVPTNLVPGQLYTLGISYFKAREDEKAAVIFTFLTGLDDSEIFKTPKNFLLTGIAWYRLDNFATAERYFDRALKAQDKPENLQTLAHARLWKALTSSRINKHTQSQFWLTELIDHHPLSLEASWVNSKFGGRGPRSPASKSSEAHDGADTEE